MAGAWVAELSRVWVDTFPQLKSRSLILDLRNVTYADEAGTDALKSIVAQSQARLISASPWTEYLAQQISNSSSNGANEEVGHASFA